MKKGSSRTVAAAFAAGVMLAAVAPRAFADAADVASLYGPQPPADAAYLRVLNASSQPVRLAFTGSGPAQQLAPHAVTRYSVLRPGEPLRATVDSQTVPLLDGGSTTASAGDYVTLAVQRGVHGWQARAVTARADRVDGLKATLRAYNFASNCAANIGVAGAGANVFGNLTEGSMQTRAINPVKASLVGQCGAVTAAPVMLPQLAAGEGYSLFVLGDAANPVLAGARDTLAWPPAAH
jgi:alginate O-acetyltransferase complex protein AlgF